MQYTARLSALAATLVFLSSSAALAQVAPPGDSRLRSDLQWLLDSGLMRGPVTDWPVSPADIDAALERGTGNAVASATIHGLPGRLHERMPQRGLSLSTALSGTNEVPLGRGFDALPREEGGLAVALELSGERCFARLEAQVVASPGDDQSARPDGTVAACRLGNWSLSAGWEDRWWGPGWAGSLILGNAARPFPALALQRLQSMPSTRPVLRWAGPWRLSMFAGQLEDDREDVSQPLFLGARLTIQPLEELEIGFSRTVQVCGDGRPCDFSTFLDLLRGYDNIGIDVSPENEPGNQMAGFDLRLRSPWPGMRVAVYSQMIGEDESGFLPVKYLAQFGAESWWTTAAGSLGRAYLEYLNTTCSWIRSRPRFDCAYNQRIYNSEGYRYRGRSLGYSLDRDAELWAAGAMLTRANGAFWQLELMRGRLNRGAAIDDLHSITPVPADYDSARLMHSRALLGGHIEVGVVYERLDPAVDDRSDLSGFAQFRLGF